MFSAGRLGGTLSTPSTLPRWTVPGPRALGANRVKTLVLGFALLVFSYSVINFFFLDERTVSSVHEVQGGRLQEEYDGVGGVASSLSSSLSSSSTFLTSGDDDDDDDIVIDGSDSRTGVVGSLGGTKHGMQHKWYEKLTSLNPFKSKDEDDDDYGYNHEGYEEDHHSGYHHGNPHHQNHKTIHSSSLDRVSLGERTRIAKVSILYGHPNPVYERALRTHEAHDRLHNYPIRVVRERILDGLWTKPAYILSLILQELEKPESQRLEWLFWVDADTIVLNYKVPIELFLPPEDEGDDDKEGSFRDVYMLVSHDWNGLNNGVFPVRINAWSAELFAAIVAFRDFRPDTHLVFNDQSAMDFVLQERKFAKHVVQVPQRWFNAYQGEANETLAPHQVRRGDFLVHFPGVGSREARMRFWLDRAEQHMPEWEMEVQHTSYPNEVREFWAQQRRERQEMKAVFRKTVDELSEYIGWVEKQCADHGGSIAHEALVKIQDEVNAAKGVTERKWEMKKDLDDALTSLARLKEMSKPLSQASAEANKSLVKTAHEVIFAAEHVALEFGSTPVLQEEVRTVEAKVDALKGALSKEDVIPDEVRGLVEEVRTAKQLLTSKSADLEETGGRKKPDKGEVEDIGESVGDTS